MGLDRGILPKGDFMARFYAEVHGNRGPASRMGTSASGMSAHIRGWRVGARVECCADGEHDLIRVYRTTGSNGSCGADVLLAELTDKPPEGAQ